ncbi:anti-sigma factor family protein [Zavarzinella formosa]|uniref:anti-sigma factor family protein n=1 Tax=Zavarzinella formosa TaxID=360055 RepID=UPI00030BF827|nr:hypothetical protein [Zavarzinella formosa]
MNGPAEDDLSPELLAAYVDGELPPELAERVARWLATNPEALSMADDQAALTPLNEEVREELFDIPMPKPDQWNACLAGIRGELASAPRRPWNIKPFLAGFTVAAGLLLTLLAGTRDRHHPLAFVLPVDDADDEMIVLANSDDIEILSLPEAAASLLVVGDHPWNEDLVLAKSHELEFIGVGSDAEGRFPDVPTDPMKQDAPLLWSPAPP